MLDAASPPAAPGITLFPRPPPAHRAAPPCLCAADGSLFTPLADDNMVASRKDYSYAEPTIEYNAGITGALAAAAEWYQQGTWTGSMKDVLSRP